MRRPQFSLKSLLWLTVVVAAFCAGTQLDHYIEEHRADPREASIRAALDEQADIKFIDRPFSGVIDYLKQRHAIEIQLDNKALGEAGMLGNMPITRSIEGVTLRSALNLLLADLDMTYVVHDGVVLITTKAEAQKARSGLFSLKMAMWFMVAMAVLLGAILCDRAWRHRADISPRTDLS